ncbi:MAG: hypothetical protein H6Q73_1277 [Firmicutes bacterium]|nr:hypothetical protein [Bacillota bacterium]
MVSVCGVCCEECPHFSIECPGCSAILGKVYWAQYIGADCCPIFKCVSEKGFTTCGDCNKMPCEVWFSLKDPDWSDDEHQKSIADRAAKLRLAR